MGRSRAQQGTHHNTRDHAPSYGTGRDPYPAPYPRGGMYGTMGMYLVHGVCVCVSLMAPPPSPTGGYDYRYGGGAGDYMRPESYAYTYAGGYPDRTAAYAYANYAGRGGYDMQSAAAAAAYGELGGLVRLPRTVVGVMMVVMCVSLFPTGMYGANGMGGSAYGQSSSTYGPSRSTSYGQMGGATDYGKDRNTSRAYHPYRRAQ